jgi:hypothetical protein
MAMPMRKKADEPGAAMESKGRQDIYEVIARLLVTFLMNYLARKLRQKGAAGREGRKARRKVGKLAKKGKVVPEDLRKEAMQGVSLRKKRKVSSKAKAAKAKAEEKPAKKKKKHRLLWLILIAGVVLIVRATKK